MAYSIKSVAIINDSRELLGVNTAGINTALYVGDLKIEDNVIEATSGVVTYVGDGRSLTGIVTVSDSGGTPEFSGNLSVDGQLSVSGLASLGGGVDVTGHIEGDSLNISGISTLATLVFNADPTLSLDGVTDDLTVEATASQLVTAEAAKAYADSIVGAGNTMEFTGNTGNTGAVDLVTETFAINGDANEIVTDVPAVDGNEITIGLSDTLVTPGSLQVTGLATFVSNVEYGTGVSFEFADDGNAITGVGIGSDLGGAGASDSILPSQKAVKDYVDNVEVQVEANANLDLATGGSDFGTVGLATQSLAIEGTANEVVVAGAGQTFTVGLANDVQLSGNFQAGIVTATSSLEVSGDATVRGILDFGSDFSAGLRGIDLSHDGTLNRGITFQTTGSSSQLIQSVGVATNLQQGGFANNNTLPTELAVKTYVDAQLGASNQLVFTDGTTNGDIDLANDTFSILGGTNVTTVVTADAGIGNTITINLDDDISLAGGITAGDTLTISAGGATITGVCTATDFNSTSDINKKENIVEIADAVEKVEALRGVTFEWKDGSGTSGGTIAQEVQAVLPEIVKEGEHLTVNYNGLTGLLIQAVKELSARVAELEAKG